MLKPQAYKNSAAETLGPETEKYRSKTECTLKNKGVLAVIPYRITIFASPKKHFFYNFFFQYKKPFQCKVSMDVKVLHETINAN